MHHTVKLVKKNERIRADEELGPFLLGDVKSQGVKALEESALVMRIKFTAKPGAQQIEKALAGAAGENITE